MVENGPMGLMLKDGLEEYMYIGKWCFYQLMCLKELDEWYTV